MSLITLPEEVLEILFSYLSAEDLLSVWTVVGLEGSESFWRKVCKREGYKRISTENGRWKSIFYRNINWMTRTFLKREYKFVKYERHLFDSENFSRIYVKDVLHQTNLIVKSDENEISVWNIDKEPVLVTKLPAQFLRVSRTKLLTHMMSLQETKIYSSNYCELLSLDGKLSHNIYSDYALTDEYFAAFDDSLTLIKVVNIENREEYTLPISTKKVKPISIVILEHILNVMVLEGLRYVLRRYHLEKREWLDDLLLFQGAALIGIPKVEIGSELLVSWSNLLISHGITPLKVWKTNGELLRSLPLDFIHSFGIQLQMPPEQILWLVIEGDYLIFSTYVTSITIWTSKDPDICKEMPKSEHFYNGQSVISSRLLLLSYTCCFKVVDFQKAVYLYDVWFENKQLSGLDVWLPQPFFVNEYFYVYFKECHDDDDEKPAKRSRESVHEDSSSDETSYKTGESSQVESDTKTRTYILTIYDFRVEGV